MAFQDSLKFYFCRKKNTFLDFHIYYQLKIEGKYTVGLGQQRMAVVSDREDVNSMALSVFDKLVQSFKVDLKNVGRLEVGTETLVDKSKSVKR